MQRFDVLVVGGGHAGCEAAYAASRLGAEVLMVTLRQDRIAAMSCNPAVGGVGKGQLVREIDALGGAMGRIADATGIQFRRLNASRGPAVQSTRSQNDSKRYREAMTALILGLPRVVVVEGEVKDIRVVGDRSFEATCSNIGDVGAHAVVVTTGTFLNGLCHVGDESFAGGRVGDSASSFLSQTLVGLGLRLSRFKTGTTPRLLRESLRLDGLDSQPPDQTEPRFSFEPVQNDLPQVTCHITHTTILTHEVIRNGLSRSPLFQGVIKGRGPRYCPSIEDKVVRFASKESHQIFLEPEGLDSDWIYPNGLSTSLPKDVQLAFLHSIPGLENAKVAQFGYAVEYDYADPTQIMPSLMSKVVPGLFLAGQINGTSGYEEAGAQGLMAGTNAARFVDGQSPIVLTRDQAYIGVLIDDLVTKGVDEPYRMFTSRAEHRLTLRESNAEQRLLAVASACGLLPDDRKQRAEARVAKRQALRKLLESRPVGEELAQGLGLEQGEHASSMLAVVLRRPEIRIWDLLEPGEDPAVMAVVEEDIKYDGYVRREQREISRLAEMENVPIPDRIDYVNTSGLSAEIREKLSAVRPTTLGQASRIPGITPAALLLLRVHAHNSSRECFT